MPQCQIEKIVSGGQTGVDRAALDVAIFLDIPHGGWCPQGRRAEDGRIPESYLMRETTERDYSVRTERNIIDSDGTLILFRKQTSGGTKLTCKLARKYRRPLVCVDLDHLDESELERVFQWIVEYQIHVLNIAGPRESSCQGIGKQVERFLVDMFRLA